MKSLKDSPKRFSELKRITGFSDRGISKMLKGLQEEGLIDHNPKNKQYYIANTGLKLLKSADISHITNRIRNDDGMYYPNYSDMSQVFLPQRATGAVRPFMYIDKNLDLLNLLSASDVEDIETLMFKKLSNII
ncbi:MAG: hypothetical protein IIC67_01995 [Thaumarchaeota archaeon]|nr:hypothetical protein [Nitrososphaerota archaeon]